MIGIEWLAMWGLVSIPIIIILGGMMLTKGWKEIETQEKNNKRLLEWINWLQDEAVVNWDDSRVGLFRKIKEGLSVNQFMKGE